ncbi:MAG: HAD family hydrolase, partial [Leeuwenhoekiella sp.]|nr:HAD family hydrolase [Leeuwenhoekiella sp.]
AKALKIPMGIGTAAPKENAEFAIEALSLQPYFKTVVHSDMVQRGKPDPQVFEMVAEHLNIKLSESLIFEDSPTGAKAAANGNSKSIILTTTHSESEFSTIPAIQHFMPDYTQIKLSKGIRDLFYIEY